MPENNSVFATNLFPIIVLYKAANCPLCQITCQYWGHSTLGVNTGCLVCNRKREHWTGEVFTLRKHNPRIALRKEKCLYSAYKFIVINQIIEHTIFGCFPILRIFVRQHSTSCPTIVRQVCASQRQCKVSVILTLDTLVNMIILPDCVQDFMCSGQWACWQG